VKQAHWELDNEARDLVRVIDEVEVDHVAVCSPQQAVNPRTCLRAVEGEGVLGEVRRGFGARMRDTLRRLWGKERTTTATGANECGPATAVEQLDQARAELEEVNWGLQGLRAELAAAQRAKYSTKFRPESGLGAKDGKEAEIARAQGGGLEAGSEEGHEKLQLARGGAATRGRRRGLEGQERTGGRDPVGRMSSDQLWKGVL
jgi:hypothetical protein